MSNKRKEKTISGIQPDSKSQVTLQYEGSKALIKCTEVVVSTQHDKELELSDVEEIVTPFIKEALPDEWLQDTKFHINPTGRFETGGPDGDTGLTGRKLLLILMVVQHRMAVAHFLVKIQQKLIDQQLILQDILLKM